MKKETKKAIIDMQECIYLFYREMKWILNSKRGKNFQFMMLGKPVVVSSTRPMMRVVRDAQCGLIFTERDPHALAEAIIKLEDADLRRRLGENGRQAVADRYNWQQTVQVLLELYHSKQGNILT